MRQIGFAILASSMLAAATPLAAQDEAPPAQVDEVPAAQNDRIVVTGEQPDESLNEQIRRIGKQITRPARSGKPIARFRAPLCLMVSGLPPEFASLIKARIEDNARQLRGFRIASKPDCDPNAFVGVLNNVNDAVKQLEKDEPWLFEGLLSFQKDRIYKGSSSVRAWHLFEVRNQDGTSLPEGRTSSSAISGSGQFEGLINRAERASRFNRLRNDLAAGVVLIETAALKDKTMRQIADYATFRLLASVGDDIQDDPENLPTILTLFNEDYAPPAITDFDVAYLESLYELPSSSREETVISSAVKRYNDRLAAEGEG